MPWAYAGRYMPPPPPLPLPPSGEMSPANLAGPRFFASPPWLAACNYPSN